MNLIVFAIPIFLTTTLLEDIATLTDVSYWRSLLLLLSPRIVDRAGRTGPDHPTTSPDLDWRRGTGDSGRRLDGGCLR